MSNSFTATKSIIINATSTIVWKALTSPEIVKQYMFDAEVVSDWQPGSSLIYKGMWEGKPYEDKGTIIEIEPERLLRATYYSALSGLEDKPENYNTVTYKLTAGDGSTKLTVIQDNNPTQEAADKAAENWGMVLKTIKQLLEKAQG
ncbi:MAG TPA: SRPBCC domain-containing protein [Candidatus Saccharimonadales bacterium]|nr:SRPBCC domain-containing protein [Candidatus Saccharimonadales bacterium]